MNAFALVTRRAILTIALLLAPSSALGRAGYCVAKKAAIDAAVLTSSQVLEVSLSSDLAYSTMSVFVYVTDADGTIDTLTATCQSAMGPTSSNSVATPYRCDTTVNGTCVLQADGDANDIDLAIGASVTRVFRLDPLYGPTTKCTFAVSAGSADADIDLLTVDYWACSP